eukprot:scaffold41107_cov17-Tisochrysis_lutea.AAC.1
MSHLIPCSLSCVAQLLGQSALLSCTLRSAVQLKQQLGTLLVHSDLAHGRAKEGIRRQQASTRSAGRAAGASRGGTVRGELGAHGSNGGTHAGGGRACSSERQEEG